MKISLLMIITIIACSFFSLTQALGTECSIAPNGAIISAMTDSQTHNLNCSYITDIENLITDIQKMSDEKMAVNIITKTSFDNASFDGGSIIEVPEQFIFHNAYEQEYSSSLAATLVVVAHEYGHALLQKKLERTLMADFPEYAGFILARQEISRLQLENTLHPSPELAESLSRKITETTNNQNFIRFIQLTTGYSELFADVVAVYYKNDKSAMLKALYYDQMSTLEFQNAQTRDFDTIFDSRFDKFMTDPHGFFAYTRTYIGKNLWPLNEAKKKTMLIKLSDAIVSEIRQSLKNKTKLPDFQTANKQLIKRLQTKSIN